jgi:hypothetical protein
VGKSLHYLPTLEGSTANDSFFLPLGSYYQNNFEFNDASTLKFRPWLAVDLDWSSQFMADQTRKFELKDGLESIPTHSRQLNFISGKTIKIKQDLKTISFYWINKN